MKYRKPTSGWVNIWNWGRLGMYGSGEISEIIVIYLFLQLSGAINTKINDH
jgi:hypothetical protein